MKFQEWRNTPVGAAIVIGLTFTVLLFPMSWIIFHELLAAWAVISGIFFGVMIYWILRNRISPKKK